MQSIREKNRLMTAEFYIRRFLLFPMGKLALPRTGRRTLSSPIGDFFN
jgi:hypothetical protein